MHIRWHTTEMRGHGGRARFYRADLEVEQISITDMRAMIAAGWQMVSWPYGACDTSPYRFVRTWEVAVG